MKSVFSNWFSPKDDPGSITLGGATHTVYEAVKNPIFETGRFVAHNNLVQPLVNAVSKNAHQEETNASGTPPASHDATLDSMNRILKKRLKGVTLEEFYDACWKEAAFYETWLQNDNKLEVSVGEWEVFDNGILGHWDGELYFQRRIVKYMYTRDPSTLGYSLGQPRVYCTQVQYYRADASSSVLAMTLTMDGEVFSDSFAVQIRGVATKINKNDLVLDFGVYCLFTKQTLVANQIRTLTTSATQESMLDLFQHIQNVLGVEANADDDLTTDMEASLEDDEEDNHDSPCFSNLFGFCHPGRRQDVFRSDVEQAMHEIYKKLNGVLHLPARSSAREAILFTNFELVTVKEALDNILIRNVAQNKKGSGADKGMLHRGVLQSIRGMRTIVPSNRSMHALLHPSDRSRDKILQGMTVICSEHMSGTVKEVFAVAQIRPFYTSWLEDEARQNVTVGPWEEEGDYYIEPWSGEKFHMKRRVSYQAPMEHGDDGSMLLVTQTNHLRMEEDGKKMVLASHVETEGYRFSDVFSIQVRWVVVPFSKDMISIKVGVFIVECKRMSSSRKVHAEITRSLTKHQQTIMHHLKATVVANADYAIASSSRSGTSATTVTAQEPEDFQDLLAKCFPWIQNHRGVYPGTMIAGDEELVHLTNTIHRRLRAVQAILTGGRESSEDAHFYLSQLVIIREALDNVLCWFKQ